MDPLWFVYRFLQVDVEMTLEVPTPPLVVVDNDVVEVVTAELMNCKSDHEQELELVHRLP
jgi:hypothetical protein